MTRSPPSAAATASRWAAGAAWLGGAHAGATVACGQPMVRWDPAAVQAGGLSPICPVVALDATAGELSDLAGGSVSPGDPLFSWS